MDLFEQTRGRPSPKRGIQLQGPRPAPLKVNKDSHKLKKPSFPPPPTAPSAIQRRPPVIIYTVSPKIIHTKPSEFMSLVQRLTGCSASNASAATATTGNPTDNNLSAAEQNSPAQSKTTKDQDDTDELRRLFIGGGSTTGIQPISPNFFSPSVVDINQFSFFHELNVPALHGNKGMMDGGFISSPVKVPWTIEVAWSGVLKIGVMGWRKLKWNRRCWSSFLLWRAEREEGTLVRNLVLEEIQGLRRKKVGLSVREKESEGFSLFSKLSCMLWSSCGLGCLGKVLKEREASRSTITGYSAISRREKKEKVLCHLQEGEKGEGPLPSPRR
ncbi:hypothetical protein IEQ34_000781 [Dendrobium chrysotoxum]|uniref:VQ domain-containing protein n=1 Tax=Dendrobium chrysotoxum TaxID=161865 RepID=A0AAV7HT78_DENCH|nr:hypothetical protein IEQ34_000781 [Dendrobium chrysotoxum]